MARPKRLLIEERPLMVSPTLAAALGINEAILLQQLHFLLTITEESKNRHNFVNGRWWVYNNYKEWKTEQFPWLHEGTIKRLFLTLEEWGLVDSMQSVKNPSDRKKWYSIDYDALDGLEMTIGTNCDDGSTEQIVTMVGTNCDDGYSENTSETKENNLRANDARAEPPQASLFGTAEPLPVEKVSPAKKPPVSRPFYDAIFTVFGAVEAYNGLIQKAMEGRISKRHTGHEANFTIPATPEETLAFGEWWGKKYPDATPPLALDKIQNHFEAFRRERVAAEQAKQPRLKVRNGRVLKYDSDMKQWFDIGPEKENVPHENDIAQAEQRNERKAPAVEHGSRGGANWLAAD